MGSENRHFHTNQSDHFIDHSSYASPLVSIIEGSSSEEGVIHRRSERLLVVDSEDSSQLCQQVTIGTLPDDVLLNIFKSFIEETDCDDTPSNEWHALVHVCQRWRNLAFTSPRHLDLRLLYIPRLRSVKDMLDIWPEIPIYVRYSEDLTTTKEVRDNAVAALNLNHRVSRIWLQLSSDSQWEALWPLMQRPFPALTRLLVWRSLSTEDVIPRSFLGGSAPSLRDLCLNGVQIPALPELLLSATNLVHLRYNNIRRSGYISPQAMVTGLSALTRLESLSLTFQSPKSLPDRELRIPPPHTRTLLPALTDLRFRGVILEYMEYLVAQIDTPSLESMEITFFHQEVLEVSELAKFIHRADKLSLIDRGEIIFSPKHISIKLSQHLWNVDPKTLMIKLACLEWDFQVAHLAQFCASCLATPSPFESLYIRVPPDCVWQHVIDVIDDPDPQWLEVLRPFNTVKHLRLSRSVAPHIAQSLRRLPLERVTEVLPTLEVVFISGLERFRPVEEAMTEFANARQVSGHPVSIYDWEHLKGLVATMYLENPLLSPNISAHQENLPPLAEADFGSLAEVISKYWLSLVRSLDYPP